MPGGNGKPFRRYKTTGSHRPISPLWRYVALPPSPHNKPQISPNMPHRVVLSGRGCVVKTGRCPFRESSLDRAGDWRRAQQAPGGGKPPSGEATDVENCGLTADVDAHSGGD